MEEQKVILLIFKTITIKVSDPQLDASKNFVTYLVSGNDYLGTF